MEIKNNSITFEYIQKKHYFPNTYTFTKCLAEKFIQKEITNGSQIIYNIIRPFIITVAESIPYTGWFQGFAGALGHYVMTLMGYIKNFNCLNSKLNIVPVDYVSQIITSTLNSIDNNIILAISPYSNRDYYGLNNIFNYYANKKISID